MPVLFTLTKNNEELVRKYRWIKKQRPSGKKKMRGKECREAASERVRTVSVHKCILMDTTCMHITPRSPTRRLSS